MQEELAAPVGVSVGYVAVLEGSDVQVVEPGLTAADEREGIGELGVVVTQRTDLSAGQLDPASNVSRIS